MRDDDERRRRQEGVYSARRRRGHRGHSRPQRPRPALDHGIRTRREVIGAELGRQYGQRGEARHWRVHLDL